MSTARGDHGELENSTVAGEPATRSAGSRRGLLGAAAGGFALAASGLFVPKWLEAAAGEKPVRRVQDGTEQRNRKQRTEHRRNRHDHGDKQDKRKDKGQRDDAPPQGQGLFRTTALTVRSNQSVTCTFYHRIKTGLDDYGPWIQDSTQTLTTSQVRYAPGRYRIGVLVTPAVPVNTQQVFADVRNLSFGYPQGAVTRGNGPLDPVNNNFGNTTVVRETGFFVDELHEGPLFDFFARGSNPWVWLQREKDSDGNIEFVLDFHCCQVVK